MRQLPPFARLVSAVLFAAVCAYAAAALFTLFERSASETLIEARAEDTVSLDGIALRFEQAVCSERGAPFSAENGERVAANQPLVLSDGAYLESPCSAVFFDGCDGYEALSVTEDAFSAECLNALFRALDTPAVPEKSSGKLLGRIVKERKWYFAAWADCAALDTGRYVIRFDGFEDRLDCAVVRSFPDADGKTAVLIRLPIGKNEYLSLRRCSAEIILHEYAGLKVSQSAALCDDGGTKCTVKKITAAGEKDCAADIIYRGDGFFIISPTDELFAGAKVKRR